MSSGRLVSPCCGGFTVSDDTWVSWRWHDVLVYNQLVVDILGLPATHCVPDLLHGGCWRSDERIRARRVLCVVVRSAGDMLPEVLDYREIADTVVALNKPRHTVSAVGDQRSIVPIDNDDWVMWRLWVVGHIRSLPVNFNFAAVLVLTCNPEQFSVHWV